jgi:DNA-binding FadR family transcriptional regulator
MAIDYNGLVTEGFPRQIADTIRAAILEGKLVADERLPTEEELATRFGVSRPTIREALKRLAAQNLVRSRRGPAGGTFVTVPTQEETRLLVANAASLLVSMGEFSLAHLAEARLLIESACCHLAARRRTRAQMDRLRIEIERQSEPTLSDEMFCASDVEFHRILVEAADNPALSFASAGIVEAVQPAINLAVFRLRDRRTVVKQHKQIVDALDARDGESAAAALAAYMKTLRVLSQRVRNRRKADRDSADPTPGDRRRA